MNKITYQDLRKTGMFDELTILLLPEKAETYQYGQGIWDNVKGKEIPFKALNPDETNKYAFLSNLNIESIMPGAFLSTSFDEKEDDDDYYDEDKTEGHQFYDLSAYDLVVVVELTAEEFKDFELKEDE